MGSVNSRDMPECPGLGMKGVAIRFRDGLDPGLGDSGTSGLDEVNDWDAASMWSNCRGP
jgi:hypothetical protein